MIKIAGLDDLAKSMEELQRAVSELDGNLAELSFDPEDPASIERAVHTAEASIDEKISGFAGNEMVASLGEDLKEATRQSILERAAAARLEGDEEE